MDKNDPQEIERDRQCFLKAHKYIWCAIEDVLNRRETTMEDEKAEFLAAMKAIYEHQ